MADEVCETKPFYMSKMLWVNAIAAVALIVQTQTGFILNEAAQGAILIVINLVLRIFTKNGVAWG